MQSGLRTQDFVRIRCTSQGTKPTVLPWLVAVQYSNSRPIHIWPEMKRPSSGAAARLTGMTWPTAQWVEKLVPAETGRGPIYWLTHFDAWPSRPNAVGGLPRSSPRSSAIPPTYLNPSTATTAPSRILEKETSRPTLGRLSADRPSLGTFVQ